MEGCGQIGRAIDVEIFRRVSSALPKKSPPPFTEVDHARVTAVRFAYSSSQTRLRSGDGNDMGVVGQQAIGPDGGSRFSAPFCEKGKVGLIVFRAKKGRLAAIPTLSDMMGEADCDDARHSCHAHSPRK